MAAGSHSIVHPFGGVFSSPFRLLLGVSAPLRRLLVGYSVLERLNYAIVIEKWSLVLAVEELDKFVEIVNYVRTVAGYEFLHLLH